MSVRRFVLAACMLPGRDMEASGLVPRTLALITEQPTHNVRTCTASDGVCLIGMPGKSSHMLRPCMWPAVRAKCLARLVSPGALFPGSCYYCTSATYHGTAQAGIRTISSLVAADLPSHRGINLIQCMILPSSTWYLDYLV
ncbi:hypothetical protein V8C34DRAFT_274889 [Trichoderma compactum]